MLYVGMDDTDSKLGMCTTYLAAVLAERLAPFGLHGYPRLIRLNPNIKYKTRGNAALCLVLENGPVDEVERIVLKAVEELAWLEDKNTNPGVVIHEGGVPDEVRAFALRVVRDVVEIDEAVKLADKYGMRVRRFKNGRGVIGALASIGLDLYDHTYELIAYRTPENRADALTRSDMRPDEDDPSDEEIDVLGGLTYKIMGVVHYENGEFDEARRDFHKSFEVSGPRWFRGEDARYLAFLKGYEKPRYLNSGSVYAMDAATYPDTWDNVDLRNKVIVFSPHTPDPVLYGIRGNSPDVLLRAQKMLETEPVERSQIFITNQGTDMHLISADISEAHNDHSYVLRGFIDGEPHTIEGGHVFFDIEQAGSTIKCAAFEPTKNFREIVKKLIKGDEVRVYGSVKNDTVNLEKLEAVKLAEQYHKLPPKCPACGKSMESVGKDKGYRCRKCGARQASPVYEKVERDLELGLYEVPPSARRHLAKQIIRIKEPWCRMHPSR